MRPSEVFGYLFDVGKDILCTTFSSNGVVTAQTGDSTTQTPDADSAEWWQHTGFASRSAIPSVGNASCQALVLKRSDKDIIFATRDVRGTSILGNLADGETCVYAAASQAQTLYKADGSVTHMATDDNTATGNALMLRVDPTGFTAYSPNVGFTGDKMGWRFSTWHGARFTMSGIGLPAPFASLGLNSMISLSADMITLDAAVLNIGRVGGTGIAQGVAQAVPLAAVLTSITAALSDLATAVGAFTGSGTFPGLAAAVTAIAAAATEAAGASQPVALGGTATNTSIA
jgi:hypothetical protein